MHWRGNSAGTLRPSRFDLETKDSANCITLRMPYITKACFIARLNGDSAAAGARWFEEPSRSSASFGEIPDDVFLRWEYSVRAAQWPYIELLGVNRKIPSATP